MEAIGDLSMIDVVTIAGVMFANSSRTFFVDAGNLTLAVGDRVLVQIDQEVVVGEVVIAPNQVVASDCGEQTWPIIRPTTASDPESLSALATGDETTALLGGLGRDDNTFCCKTVTTDFISATTWQKPDQGEQVDADNERGDSRKAFSQTSAHIKADSSFCAFPRLDQNVNTPEGPGIVKAINIFQELVTVELPGGVAVEIPVGQCVYRASEQN